MTHELLEGSRRGRAFADVALIVTTIALMLSLVVAVSAVSIGMARAGTLGGIAESGGGRFALAGFLTLAVAGMGGFSALIVRDDESTLRRD